MVTGPEAAHAGKDAHLCAGLNSVIKGLVHRVQYIWDVNSTKENWGLNLLTLKTNLTGLIKSECCGRFVIYGPLELVFKKLLPSLVITCPVKRI